MISIYRQGLIPRLNNMSQFLIVIEDPFDLKHYIGRTKKNYA